jgi:serine/threonine-protein phosphatase 2A regulatory subunit B'
MSTDQQNLTRTKSGEAKSKSPSGSKSTPSITTSSSSSPGPSSPAPSSPITSRNPATSNPSPLSDNSLSAHGQGSGAGAGQPNGLPTTPRRSPVSEKTSPAPPLVVISGAPNPINSEMPVDPIPHAPHGRHGSPDRVLGPDGQPTPPRAGPLNRLRGPKDTISIVGKTPRKQRSSRFYVTEKVEIEKLPGFAG